MAKLFEYVFYAFLGTIFLVSCNRPVAYFLSSTHTHFTNPLPQLVTHATSGPVIDSSTTSLHTAQQVTYVTATLDLKKALVRSDSKLVHNQVQQRLNQVHRLLPTATTGSYSEKTTLLERLMLRKINRKISRHLAPANPNRPMAEKGLWITGAALILIGVLLFVLASSGGVFIGTIVAAIGVTLLLIGLF